MIPLGLCAVAALAIGWRQCVRGLDMRESGLGAFMSGIVLILCGCVALLVASLKAFA